MYVNRHRKAVASLHRRTGFQRVGGGETFNLRSRVEGFAIAMSADNKLPTDTITFSLMNGTVWASWPGKGAVELGESDAVTTMMTDFLAQYELGKQLARRNVASG
jgi:hypothetical protein